MMGENKHKNSVGNVLWDKTPLLCPTPVTVFGTDLRRWRCDLEGVFYRTVPTDDPTWSGDQTVVAIEVVYGNDLENIVTVPSMMYVHNPSHSDLVFTLDETNNIVVQSTGRKGCVTIQYDVYKGHFVVYVLDTTIFIVINGHWMSTVRVDDVREKIERDNDETLRLGKSSCYGLKIGGNGENECAVLTNKYGTWITAPDTDLKLDSHSCEYCIFDSGVVVTVSRVKFKKWFRGVGKVAKNIPNGGWSTIHSDVTLPADYKLADMFALPRDLVGMWTIDARLWIVTLEQDVVSIVDLRCGPGTPLVRQLWHIGRGEFIVITKSGYPILTRYRTEDGRECVLSHYFKTLGGNAKSRSAAGMDGVDLALCSKTEYCAVSMGLFRPVAYWLLLMYHKQQDSPFYKTRFPPLLKQEVCRWLF